ncbi:unnamed protein product [Lupinus luteus]|uniref:Uncharacterized protein n=1 Tax=Lupinus luteus TaxID=3873 RepID=A0AAV1VY95_LUPLU
MPMASKQMETNGSARSATSGANRKGTKVHNFSDCQIPPQRTSDQQAHACSWCGSALRASPNTTPFHSEKGPTGNRYAEVHQFFLGKTAQHCCMRHTPPHLHLNHENQPQTHFRMIGLPRLPAAAVPLRGSPNTSSFRAGRVTLQASEHPWDAANTNSTPRDQTSTSTDHTFPRDNTFPRDKPTGDTLLHASQTTAP